MSQFERIKYPDGQISATFSKGSIASFSEFSVKQRINNYEDLFYVRAIADIIHTWGDRNWTLFIPCMFGQRSDRRFSNFQSFDLKLIADVINSCRFKQVSVFDPHSDVTLALLDNSVKISSFEHVQLAVFDLKMGGVEDLMLVSPDGGAYKKVFEYGEKLNLPVMAAVKHRDLMGKVDLTFTGDVKGKRCLIVDDLCDGGYTFVSLAKQLRAQGAKNVYLYVSHGLFSKGFVELEEVINHIYCTNSVSDLDGEKMIYGFHEPYQAVKDYVTQYKII